METDAGKIMPVCDTTSEDPLRIIIEEIESAIPFDKKNAKLLAFVRDPEPSEGELYECLHRESIDSEQLKDLIFQVKGICNHQQHFALSPKVVPMARRSNNVKVDTVPGSKFLLVTLMTSKPLEKVRFISSFIFRDTVHELYSVY